MCQDRQLLYKLVLWFSRLILATIYVDNDKVYINLKTWLSIYDITDQIKIFFIQNRDIFHA